MNNIKSLITAILCISVFFAGTAPAFAKSTSKSPSSTSASTAPKKALSVCPLATTPMECISQDISCRETDLKDPSKTNTYIFWGQARNCLFLEEPIGGKPGYDLFLVTCGKHAQKKTISPKGEQKDEYCIYTLWRGEAVPKGAAGPVQAILTEDKSKPYYGPFTLLYNYVDLIYKYLSGIIVGVAVLFIVIGGIEMTVSAGGEQFNKGKSRIIKAVVGIIIWFTASLILYTINPTFFAF